MLPFPMSMSEHPLMIIGHKNPDTDSICSAIAYAHFKQQVIGVPATPYRAGPPNLQTSFVLSHFGVSQPELITTVSPRLADIMIQAGDLLLLRQEDPLARAQEIMGERRFSFVPVVDGDGKFLGKISALRLAGLTRELAGLCQQATVTIDFKHFLQAVDGRLAAGGPPPALFRGQVMIKGISEPAAFSGGDLVVLVSGRDKADLFTAIKAGATILLACGVEEVSSEVREQAGQQGICLLTSPRDVLSAVVQLCLSMPIQDFIEHQHPTFRPYDLVRHVQREIGKHLEGGFVVVDDHGSAQGVVTRLSFLKQSRFRVALVDHNELSQAVDGIEEANVEEIIDHHRLGNRGTDMPITFINKVVGSTATIIAELYHTLAHTPPPAIAGLMLSAILSDTVILKSPTTTDLDRTMAAWLAKLADVEIQPFGEEMLSAGCALDATDPRQLVRQDLKIFQEGGWKLSVSQMETVGFNKFHDIRAALTQELERALDEAQCQLSCLMITDITKGSSLLLCAGEAKIIDAITYPRIGENLFEMKSVLSRKKQMMPYLLDLIRRL